MAKYQFRLTTLLKLRKARRDQTRIALAEAFRAEQVLAARIAEVTKQLFELRELQRAATAETYLDVARLLEAQRYEVVLKAEEQQLAKQQALLSTETERRRLTVVEADREVKALELLSERQRTEHLKDQRRGETKELDEAAMMRQSRNETGVAT